MNPKPTTPAPSPDQLCAVGVQVITQPDGPPKLLISSTPGMSDRDVVQVLTNALATLRHHMPKANQAEVIQLTGPAGDA